MTVTVSTFIERASGTLKECTEGIDGLDRIVVATPSFLSARTRTALIPVLYAYWERFFRLSIAIYLEFVEANGLRCEELTQHLASFHSLRTLRLNQSREHHKRLFDKLSKGSSHPSVHFSGYVSFHEDAKQLLDTMVRPVEFPEPESWVETDSNVGFAVVRSHYRKLGLDIESLKTRLIGRGYELHTRIEELKSRRNDIAHGSSIEGTLKEEWGTLKGFSVALIESMFQDLDDAATERRFSRS